MHRSETQIDPEINWVNAGRKNETKITAMLQLRHSKDISIPY